MKIIVNKKNDFILNKLYTLKEFDLGSGTVDTILANATIQIDEHTLPVLKINDIYYFIPDINKNTEESDSYIIQLDIQEADLIKTSDGGSGGSQTLQQILENGSQAELSSTDEEEKEFLVSITKTDTSPSLNILSEAGSSQSGWGAQSIYSDTDNDIFRQASIGFQTIEDRTELNLSTQIGIGLSQNIYLGKQDGSSPRGILIEDSMDDIGLQGNTYFGDNATDNTYVQKKYVDDAITLVIPTPPETGDFVLQSSDGVISWVAVTP